MRTVVLDTNVLISAGLSTRGAPFQILYDWVFSGKVQIAVCPAILSEYRKVFERAKFRKHGFPPPWLEPLIAQSHLLPDPPPWTTKLPDPDDAVFLSLSAQSGAWLITGNEKHFPAEKLRDVRVISPAAYLAHLRAS